LTRRARAQDNFANPLNIEETNELQELKYEMLKAICEYYAEIAKSHTIGAYLQAFVGVLAKRPQQLKWNLFTACTGKWIYECDLPHRRAHMEEEGYYVSRMPNVRAVGLALGAALIQIIAPMCIIIFQFYKKKKR
jgi:hypothetical protein